MPQTHFHDGAASRMARDIAYHDGLARTGCRQGWYHDGSAPRLIFALPAAVFTPAGPGKSFGSATTTTVNPQIRFAENGEVLSMQSGGSFSSAGGGLWGSPATPGIGVGYWIRVADGQGNANFTSGSSATNQWLRLDVFRSWTIPANVIPQQSGANFRVAAFQIASDAGGATVVVSGQIELLSERE